MLKYKNLLVSGCSFTFNRGWAEHIKHQYNINLINVACSGAGNTHIADSIVHKLEFNPELTAKNTYVIIMWSGADRMDTMCDIAHQNDRAHYKYNDSITTLTTGGIHRKQGVLGALYDVKNEDILALETFLNITNTYHYLKSRGYQFKFLVHRDMKLPAKDRAFDWHARIPEPVDSTHMFTHCMTPYEYAVRENKLSQDDYHPSEQGFVEWCDKYLIPEIHHEIVN